MGETEKFPYVIVVGARCAGMLRWNVVWYQRRLHLMIVFYSIIRSFSLIWQVKEKNVQIDVGFLFHDGPGRNTA